MKKIEKQTKTQPKKINASIQNKNSLNEIKHFLINNYGSLCPYNYKQTELVIEVNFQKSILTTNQPKIEQIEGNFTVYFKDIMGTVYRLTFYK